MTKTYKIFSFLLASVLCLGCAKDDIDYSRWYGTPDEENNGDTPSGPDAPAAEFELSVMSFNVRYPAAADTGEKAWSNRKKGVFAMIDAKKPMLIGLQECYLSQRDAILKACDNYLAYGVGRDDGNTKGESTSILYDKNLFSLKEYGTFWLSETPTKPSTGWGATIKRTTTWVKLELKSNGRQFYFVNTHLDHQSAKAKEEGLKLIQKKIDEMNGAGLPVVLTGDFNESTTSTIFKNLSLKDARVEAKLTDNFATSNGWGEKSQLIDHIFYGDLDVLSFETIRDRWEGYTYISDHYPVMAKFNFIK